jgi:hypothetical protein
VLILLLMGFRVGLYATLTAYVDNIGADLIVAQDGVQGMFSSNSALPLDIHEQSMQAANATEAGHILMADIIFTSGDTKTPVILIGYQPETTFGSPWRFSEGHSVQADDEIAMDTWLAKRSGLTIGDTVAVLGRGFTITRCTIAEQLQSTPGFCTRLGILMGLEAFTFYAPEYEIEYDIPSTLSQGHTGCRYILTLKSGMSN